MNKATNDCFQPGKPWLDTEGTHINAHGGGFLHHEGRYYWYGEFKIEGEAGNCAQVGISCYTSTDLYNWRNEGIVLPVSNEPGHEIEKGCIIERPKVLHNKSNGTFVLWAHHEKKGAVYDSAQVIVAVATSPLGPFQFLRAFRPNGQMSRDMTLFVDEEGTAWHIGASEDNATLHLNRLTPDYLDCEPDFARAFVDTYLEAPALVFQDGWYHLIGSYCTGWAPNACRHGIARSVAGPWQELPNPCVGYDNGFTFYSQSTYLLRPAGSDAVIYCGDRWAPKNAIDGTYVWLPLEIKDGDATLRWRDSWRLSDVGAKA
jgi:Glycosyl hydrolases family 43